MDRTATTEQPEEAALAISTAATDTRQYKQREDKQGDGRARRNEDDCLGGRAASGALAGPRDSGHSGRSALLQRVWPQPHGCPAFASPDAAPVPGRRLQRGPRG